MIKIIRKVSVLEILDGDDNFFSRNGSELLNSSVTAIVRTDFIGEIIVEILSCRSSAQPRQSCTPTFSFRNITRGGLQIAGEFEWFDVSE